MPRVPALAEQQVTPQQLPGARLTVDASLEAFGAGIGQALQVGAKIGNDIYLKERAEVEEAQAYEINAKLDKVSNTLLFDPEKGALTKRGFNALGAPDTVLPEFDKAAAEIEAGVTSPRVKLLARKMVTQRRSALDESLQKHVASESQKYRGAIYQDAAETALNTAGLFYNDGNRVATEIRQGEEAITRKAAMEGVPAESALQEFRSKAHRQVVNAALAKDDYAAAKAYYDGNRENMTADDAAALGKVVREGEIKVEGREQAARIAATSGSYGAALGQINKISDPEMREEVKRRTKEMFAERETLENERDKSEMESAYRDIEAGTNPDDFSPARRLALAKHMPTLRRAYDEKIGGGEPKTNYTRYVELLQEATTKPEEFGKRNLWTDVPNLGRADLERLLKVQDEIKQGKGGPELTYIGTLESVVKDKYMAATGEKKPPAEALAGFTQALQAEVQAQERVAGKKLVRADVEKIADQMLVKGYVDPQGWFNSREFMAYQLAPEDVPQGEREAIVKALQSRGIPVTPGNIQIMYAAKNKQPED